MKTWGLIASAYKLSDESGSIEGVERPHRVVVFLCGFVNQNRTNIRKKCIITSYYAYASPKTLGVLKYKRHD